MKDIPFFWVEWKDAFSIVETHNFVQIFAWAIDDYYHIDFRCVFRGYGELESEELYDDHNNPV